MKFTQLAGLMVTGLFTTVAWSGDEVQNRMKISIVEDDGNGEIRIEMPVFGGTDGTGVWFSDGMPPGSMGMEGVMIISDNEIDQATQQIIRTALESAGYDKVRFAGGHEGGSQQLHFIERVVEVSD